MSDDPAIKVHGHSHGVSAEQAKALRHVRDTLWTAAEKVPVNLLEAHVNQVIAEILDALDNEGAA